MNLLKVKIRKEHKKNILWPIKKPQKYLMVYQHLTKIFDDPGKNLSGPHSYVLKVRFLIIKLFLARLRS